MQPGYIAGKTSYQRDAHQKNGFGALECWNVSEKEKTEIGDVDKTY